MPRVMQTAKRKREIREDTSDDGVTAAPPKKSLGWIEDLDELKCPVCLELPKDQVYLCLNGHSVCYECLVKLDRCPTCRATYSVTKIRNYFAENILSRMVFDCSWKDTGCKEGGFNRQQRIDHETQCDFNPAPVKLCDILFANRCIYTVVPNALRSSNREALVGFRNHFCLRSRACDVVETVTGQMHSEEYHQDELTGNPTHKFFVWYFYDFLQLLDTNDLSSKCVGELIPMTIKLHENSELSWILVRLTETPEARKIRGKFRFRGTALPKLEWNGQIMSIYEFQEFCKLRHDCKKGKEMLEFVLPSSFLIKYFGNAEGQVNLEIVLTSAADTGSLGSGA